MRILHTSDWHLGKYLEDYSRLEEQEKFIEDLVNIVEEKNIDLVIVAGDIYDNSNPPAKAEKLFYRAMKKLSSNGQRIVLVIGGNHDNPDRLSSSRPLATEQGIILLGTPKSTVDIGSVGEHEVLDSGEGFIELSINGEKAVILTLPYPSEQRLNEVFHKGKYEEEIQKEYSEKIGEILAELSKKFREDTINICTSHIFVLGGESTDSERPIQIGGGLTVNGGYLPEKAQYIALGHLHKSQRAGGRTNAYYSGSPIQYSKSEANHKKYLYIVDLKPRQEAIIEQIELNIYKPIEIWRCNGVEEAIEKCKENKDRDVWVYLEIKTDDIITQSELKEIKSIKPDILTITPIINFTEFEEEELESFEDKTISELFKSFYVERNKIEPSEEFMVMFDEIIAQE
ncbi:exonuclease SbcCD, subunit D [Gottschalkia acidurici 9a]|uniref:Nuclease SbcCD subunit D n=1 Tax=Gottschalkia acidurici (strain ATCC 7906 / DSM 604 / BCRC 14475 / CIP 104303 / KCTC 5404 / NCIMB 10678 / 9a) TaxID=1128398 RepID=K0AYR6_GOTA9|nr:exonuclease SbcCD subunit D [Gottschalkia acidurici]AFS78913.1 exonuclease SbcCD, subunit D [Gottschalkia acidurici 9a]